MSNEMQTPTPVPLPAGARQNTQALISMISGIVTLFLTILNWTPPPIGYCAFVAPLTGIVAIITGILGIRDAKQIGAGQGQAIIGIVLGALGTLVIACAFLLGVIIGVSQAF